MACGKAKQESCLLKRSCSRIKLWFAILSDCETVKSLGILSSFILYGMTWQSFLSCREGPFDKLMKRMVSYKFARAKLSKVSKISRYTVYVTYSG